MCKTTIMRAIILSLVGEQLDCHSTMSKLYVDMCCSQLSFGKSVRKGGMVDCQCADLPSRNPKAERRSQNLRNSSKVIHYRSYINRTEPSVTELPGLCYALQLDLLIVDKSGWTTQQA